ncbi:MAG: aminopeptidase, partial [Candidatus Aminicenantes bacterium]|nr:aminopeptidase [Candidatus Aminicenantes bacterium]
MLVLFVPFLIPGQATAEPEKKSQATSSSAAITVVRDYEDPRILKLAEILVNYSVNLKKGEKILISVGNENSVPLVKAVIDQVYRIGGIPFVDMFNSRLERALYLGATAERYQLMLSWDSIKYDLMNAYLNVLSSENTCEFSDVPAEKFSVESKHYGEPLTNKIILPKLKICALRVPSASMAQAANMSSEAFADFYFRVCTVDYGKLAKAMEPLIQLMRTTDKVRIVGPGTDLIFSIKNIPAVACTGHVNIPDGELYTAPVKNSVNGTLGINQPSKRYGVTYQDIRLKFKDGKIVRASANYPEKLNQILDTDEGARYIGEFSFGLNPYIEKPMNNTLFDEKIAMSFHIAMGTSYPDADNGNHSG